MLTAVDEYIIYIRYKAVLIVYTSIV